MKHTLIKLAITAAFASLFLTGCVAHKSVDASYTGLGVGTITPYGMLQLGFTKVTYSSKPYETNGSEVHLRHP